MFASRSLERRAAMMSKKEAEYEYGSQPVGGPCTEAAMPTVRSINNMVEKLHYRLKKVDDLHEDNVRREVANALSRAEEQGYQVGYDAAMESCRITLAALEARVKDADITEKTLDEARRHIRRQEEEIQRYAFALGRLRQPNPFG